LGRFSNPDYDKTFSFGKKLWRCPGFGVSFVELVKSINSTNLQPEIHIMSTATNTIRLHRVLRSTPEKIYRAFLDADALSKWIPPYGFTCKVHHMDAKVGGTYRASFTNFSTGKSHSFGGTYRELVPGEKLRYTDKFEDPNMPGEIEVTIILKKVLCGTDISITQAGIPGVIPPEMCYLGWQESLEQLAKLAEPEIPNG
jgi:uncharacterized protein YndB with AHSA1/START domain